jgi:hypothetical protein
VFPEIVPEVAVMVVVPAAMAVPRPLLLLTVNTIVIAELQMTSVVISRVVPSAYVPVAVNCWVVPRGMLRLAGVTAMDDRAAEVTVRVVLPEIVSKVAVMVAVPVATPVTKPVLLTVAIDGSDEFQVAGVVISWFVLSENMPVAVNCWVTPRGRLRLTGVTNMEDRVAEVTT